MRIQGASELAEEDQVRVRSALLRSPLFAGISDPDAIEEFAAQTLIELRECSVGESIFGERAGGPPDLYIVLSGAVEVFRVMALRPWTKLKTRRKIMVGVYGVGDVFGEIGMLCGARTRTAEVTPFQNLNSGTCSVARFDRDGVLAFLQQQPICCFNLLTEEARRLQRASDMLVLDVEARLLHSLLNLAEMQYGHHDFLRDDHAPIVVQCTQRMLAELVGCSREWINQHLASMARQGRGVRSSPDGLVIDHPSRLFSALRYNVPR